MIRLFLSDIFHYKNTNLFSKYRFPPILSLYSNRNCSYSLPNLGCHIGKVYTA
jgi:hypothetical protein